MGFVEKMLQMDEELSLAVEFFFHFKFDRQEVEKFQTAQSGIRYFGNNCRHVDHFYQAINQGGFTRTHITG